MKVCGHTKLVLIYCGRILTWESVQTFLCIHIQLKKGKLFLLSEFSGKVCVSVKMRFPQVISIEQVLEAEGARECIMRVAQQTRGKQQNGPKNIAIYDGIYYRDRGCLFKFILMLYVG